MAKLATLHVCTSCRVPGSIRESEGNRPGFKLYQALQKALENSPLKHRVDIQPTECLSLCPRPCGFSISSPGAWHYLFGDQNPQENTEEIIAFISQYLASDDGLILRKQRPKSLQKSILGRIPPYKTCA